MWYAVNDDLRLGVAHLWKQNAVRYLANFRLTKETEYLPGLFASAGVQGIGTGNPGYAVTAEKNFGGGRNRFNVYGGIGFRSNESHSHALVGARMSFDNGWALGLQADGHGYHPFTTYAFKEYIVGAYLIDGRRTALMAGIRL